MSNELKKQNDEMEALVIEMERELDLRKRMVAVREMKLKLKEREVTVSKMEKLANKVVFTPPPAKTTVSIQGKRNIVIELSDGDSIDSDDEDSEDEEEDMAPPRRF